MSSVHVPIYLRNVTVVAATVPSVCTIPSMCTLEVFLSAWHAPFAQAVVLVVSTVNVVGASDVLMARNVAEGHLPASFATSPSNPIETPVKFAVGGDVVEATIAVDRHDTVLGVASLAVHVSEVAPTGNRDPELGLQFDVTGATPPETVGEKFNGIGEPLADVPDGAGHRIVIGALGVPEVVPETSTDDAPRRPPASYARTAT
jgi:hypothetical protein